MSTDKIPNFISEFIETICNSVNKKMIKYKADIKDTIRNASSETEYEKVKYKLYLAEYPAKISSYIKIKNDMFSEVLSKINMKDHPYICKYVFWAFNSSPKENFGLHNNSGAYDLSFYMKRSVPYRTSPTSSRSTDVVCSLLDSDKNIWTICIPFSLSKNDIIYKVNYSQEKFCVYTQSPYINLGIITLLQFIKESAKDLNPSYNKLASIINDVFNSKKDDDIYSFSTQFNLSENKLKYRIYERRETDINNIGSLISNLRIISDDINNIINFLEQNSNEIITLHKEASSLITSVNTCLASPIPPDPNYMSKITNLYNSTTSDGIFNTPKVLASF